jgi:hypothetical protein
MLFDTTKPLGRGLETTLPIAALREPVLTFGGHERQAPLGELITHVVTIENTSDLIPATRETDQSK